MLPEPPSLFQEYARSDPLAWAELIGILGAAYLAARLVTWAGLGAAFWGWTRSAGRHWTERARLAWPGCRLAAMAWPMVLVPLLYRFILPRWALSLPGVGGSFQDLLPPTATRLLFLALGIVGILHGRHAWERRVRPAVALTPRTRRATWIFTAVWVSLWTWVYCAIFARILIGRADLQLAIVAAGVTLGIAYLVGGWRVLLGWAGLRRPAPDRLSTIVARLAERMGIAPRSVEVIGLSQANALAIPYNGRIAVTDATLAVLDDDELAAVCAHELAHLGEPWPVAAARLLAGLGLLLIVTSPLFGLALTDWVVEFETVLGIGIAADVLLLCGGIAYARLHRRMEVRADAIACQFEGAPGTYARALEKLYEANATPAVFGSMRGAYPDLYDRMIAAGLAPDDARPAPPSAWPFRFGLLVLLAGAIAGGFGLDWLSAALG